MGVPDSSSPAAVDTEEEFDCALGSDVWVVPPSTTDALASSCGTAGSHRPARGAGTGGLVGLLGGQGREGVPGLGRDGVRSAVLCPGCGGLIQQIQSPKNPVRFRGRDEDVM